MPRPNACGYYQCGWNWENWNTWNDNNTYKDAAYSLADGVNETQWAIIAPFNASKASRPAQNLAAPQAQPFSVQTRVSVGNLGVMDVKPPSAGDAPSGAGKVKPPVKEVEGQEQPQGFGVKTEVLPGLTPLPSLEAQPKQSNDPNPNTNSL